MSAGDPGPREAPSPAISGQDPFASPGTSLPSIYSHAWGLLFLGASLLQLTTCLFLKTSSTFLSPSGVFLL